MDNKAKIPEAFNHEPKSDLGKKLDNFWFYNKWKIIVGIFILVAITVCTVQCVGNMATKPDVRVLYAGAMSASDPITQDMNTALSDVSPDSLGKNGAGLTVLELYSDEYVIANQDKVNAYNNSQNYKDFSQLITAGEYSLLILDKWVYDGIKEKVGFRKIIDIVGGDVTESDKLYDDSAVIFKETDFYKRYSGTFGSISDDAVICLCIYSPYKSTVGCGKSSDNDYAAAEEMFKAILNYKN